MKNNFYHELEEQRNPKFRGFILPNGEWIQSENGHEKTAREYINKNWKLKEEYKASEISDVSDFLIFKKNAIKIGSGNTPKVLQYSEKNNDHYILNLVGLFGKLGYQILPIRYSI